MQNFVITGKASTVFRLIELKAKQEEELKLLLKNRQCKYSPGEKCSKPSNRLTCSQSTCEVWMGKLGSEEFKGNEYEI